MGARLCEELLWHWSGLLDMLYSSEQAGALLPAHRWPFAAQELHKRKLRAHYYEFVLALENDGFWTKEPSKIVCLDCCTNSYRLERVKTFQLKGQKQKKLSIGKPVYTNCYVAAACMDGEGRYPALMFTHDPTFDPKGHRWPEVQQWAKKWNIALDRIIYEKSNKQYCAEATDKIAHFKHVYYDELEDCRIIHDDGNSFKKDDELIFDEVADRVVVLPSVCHGELSVLDNKLFAVAKNQWRTERPGDDFSQDALYLLWCIDWAEPEHVQGYWTRNFMLDIQPLSLAAVHDRLMSERTKGFVRQDLYENYVTSYKIWKAERGEDIEEEPLQALESDLDGVYWL